MKAVGVFAGHAPEYRRADAGASYTRLTALGHAPPVTSRREVTPFAFATVSAAPVAHADDVGGMSAQQGMGGSRHERHGR